MPYNAKEVLNQFVQAVKEGATGEFKLYEHVDLATIVELAQDSAGTALQALQEFNKIDMGASELIQVKSACQEAAQLLVIAVVMVGKRFEDRQTPDM